MTISLIEFVILISVFNISRDKWLLKKVNDGLNFNDDGAGDRLLNELPFRGRYLHSGVGFGNIQLVVLTSASKSLSLHSL